MPDLKRLQKIRSELDKKNVKLIAVSKTKTPKDILQVYEAGHRDFGENKVQELQDKEPELPRDIRWHMIGHLQRNKVKYIAPWVHMIHSVDSLKLLKEINKRARQQERIIDCLLQIHIAKEESKYGLTEDNAEGLLRNEAYHSMQNIRICGVMGMATLTDNKTIVRNEFRKLKRIFDLMKKQFFKDEPCFTEISMGMSGDYDIAIEEGATIVRIGSLVFGERKKV